MFLHQSMGAQQRPEDEIGIAWPEGMNGTDRKVF
jgi:hypothetical protein